MHYDIPRPLAPLPWTLPSPSPSPLHGKRGPADRARFYDIARGSAHECGAIVDILMARALIEEKQYRKHKTLLHRIVSMLVKLVNP